MRNRFVTGLLATVMTGALLLTGCGINGNSTLVSVDGGKESISLGYGVFVARYTQSMYDSVYVNYMGEKYWSQEQDGSTMEAMVKENILDSMKDSYVMNAHAKDYGVKLTEDEQKKVTKAAKKFIKANDKDTLEEMCATQEVVEEYLTNQTVMEKMRKAIEEETEVNVDKKAAVQSKVSYVLVSTAPQTDDQGNTTELTEDELKAAKKQAKILAKSESLETAAEKTGASVETKTYGKDDTPFADKVMKALSELEVGETSAPIGVKDVGYYVLRLDSTNDKEATAQKIEELENEQKSQHYQEVLEGWEKDLKWEVDEKQWSKVKFDSLFKAKKSAE